MIPFRNPGSSLKFIGLRSFLHALSFKTMVGCDRLWLRSAELPVRQSLWLCFCPSIPIAFCWLREVGLFPACSYTHTCQILDNGDPKNHTSFEIQAGAFIAIIGLPALAESVQGTLVAPAIARPGSPSASSQSSSSDNYGMDMTSLDDFETTTLLTSTSPCQIPIIDRLV